jgi:ornithine cyclodeaminase/alanine dehydrogenase-like protein (mu-crystallin family)
VLGQPAVAELVPLSACIEAVDSTGTAIQDVAAAVLAYERAVAAGRGLMVDLAG